MATILHPCKTMGSGPTVLPSKHCRFSSATPLENLACSSGHRSCAEFCDVAAYVPKVVSSVYSFMVLTFMASCTFGNEVQHIASPPHSQARCRTAVKLRTVLTVAFVYGWSCIYITTGLPAFSAWIEGVISHRILQPGQESVWYPILCVL